MKPFKLISIVLLLILELYFVFSFLAFEQMMEIGYGGVLGANGIVAMVAIFCLLDENHFNTPVALVLTSWLFLTGMYYLVTTEFLLSQTLWPGLALLPLMFAIRKYNLMRIPI